MAAKQSGGAGCIAWLALLLAVVALILGWTAFRRTGGSWRSLWESSPAEPRVERPMKEARDVLSGESRDLGREAALAEARVRLLARRAEIETDRNLQAVRDEVAGVRTRLERTYQGAGREARARWESIDAALLRLDRELRQGGDRAEKALDSVLDELRGSRDERQGKRRVAP
ncbi:MAG: hypothetical protein M3O15_00185 [Acidobacteriota bacterium]|nr:hypothetical protein [Acidobacteriota bacterium]